MEKKCFLNLGQGSIRNNNKGVWHLVKRRVKETKFFVFFTVEMKECFALSLPKNVPRMKMDSLSQFEGNVF